MCACVFVCVCVPALYTVQYLVSERNGDITGLYLPVSLHLVHPLYQVQRGVHCRIPHVNLRDGVMQPHGHNALQGTCCG